MRAFAAALITAIALTGAPAMAQTRTAAETRNLELVQDRFDAWAKGTGGPFELLADDAGWTITGRSAAAGVYPTKAAFMEKVIAPFNARMTSGLVPTIKSLHVDGDAVIVFFDGEALAKDGVAYRNTYAWFLDMKDGRIVRARAFYDSIAFDELWTRVAP